MLLREGLVAVEVLPIAFVRRESFSQRERRYFLLLAASGGVVNERAIAQRMAHALSSGSRRLGSVHVDFAAAQGASKAPHGDEVLLDH
jgi:hypothetical protein